MTTLLLGLVLFLGIHSVAILAPAGRDRLAARLGLAWKAGYAVVAALGLWLVVTGFWDARAHATTLYIPTAPMRGMALVLMLAVFPCLWASYLPGRIHAALRHPMLAATTVWAVAHLLANGSTADALLFGALLAWSLADRVSLRHRPSRPLPMAPAWRFNDLLVVVLGLATYGLFLGGLHRWLFGLSVLD